LASIFQVDLFKHFNVEHVAVALNGTNLSRDGHLGWISLMGRQNLLINIDCKGRSRDDKNASFWDVLEEEIFSNEKLMKVVHDCKPMVDFLFHKMNITCKNVFDTQVGSMLTQDI
jgi:hypothetical protein